MQIKVVELSELLGAPNQADHCLVQLSSSVFRAFEVVSTGIAEFDGKW
jgi:hypothetical protein